MKTMKPTTGFGETFQYSNLMVSAGEFAAGHARSPKQKLGPAYDAAMKELVFGPLGMKFDNVRLRQSRQVRPRRAPSVRPARRAGGRADRGRGVDDSGAARRRGLVPTVRDLSRVILLELGKGTIGGKEIVSEANMLERRKQQVNIDQRAGLRPRAGRRRPRTACQWVTHGGGTARVPLGAPGPARARRRPRHPYQRRRRRCLQPGGRAPPDGAPVRRKARRHRRTWPRR